ncbi:Major facilitator superfamily domain general substrate transporter [Penicillium concentricum]|uniref:Major facilitator superfamily domain general substrate transporter n=1 Tax=Penicillium concentricum TaxID=293559 RepID=A0A9W9S981_9EURO|nr:Major facilitator superfamily domain general substrate transporter [Penicillium concentricum]KAJ5371908.1 Major facilitator superfamily domain general substrate transporter [Penicillium concentricum]
MVAFRLFGALIGLAVDATTFSSVFANRIDGIVLPASLALLKDPTFGALGLLSSLFVEELTMETEELGRQHFEHESD